MNNYTTDEAARLLRVSPHTLRRWRMRGMGPAYITVGRRPIYAEADLLAFQTAHRRSFVPATGITQEK